MKQPAFKLTAEMTPDDEANGAAIRRFRKERAMVGYDLAAALDVSASHLSEMERGTRSFSYVQFTGAVEAILKHRNGK